MFFFSTKPAYIVVVFEHIFFLENLNVFNLILSKKEKINKKKKKKKKKSEKTDLIEFEHRIT